MKNFAHIAILTLAANFAAAQDWSYDLRGGIVAAQGDMAALTRKHQGYTIELGAKNKLEAAGIDYRIHVGHLVVRRTNYDVPASNPLSDTADVKGTWIGADLFYPVSKSWAVYTGPLLTTWDITAKTQGALGDTNMHLGWRLGTTWSFAESWSANASYSLSEWQKYTQRVGDPAKSATGTNVRANMNPSWVTLSIAYKF